MKRDIELKIRTELHLHVNIPNFAYILPKSLCLTYPVKHCTYVNMLWAKGHSKQYHHRKKGGNDIRWQPDAVDFMLPEMHFALKQHDNQTIRTLIEESPRRRKWNHWKRFSFWHRVWLTQVPQLSHRYVDCVGKCTVMWLNHEKIESEKWFWTRKKNPKMFWNSFSTELIHQYSLRGLIYFSQILEVNREAGFGRTVALPMQMNIFSQITHV